jgi:hypothetical protein
LVAKKNLKVLMEMYHETIEKSIFIDKRFLPLHMQFRNLYRQNIAHQAKIRELKAEIQNFKEDLAKNNLYMLSKYVTRRNPIFRK